HWPHDSGPSIAKAVRDMPGTTRPAVAKMCESYARITWSSVPSEMPSEFCEDTATYNVWNELLYQTELRLVLVKKIFSDDREFAAFAKVPSNSRAETAQFVAFTRATLSPITWRSNSGIDDAPERRMSW